MRNRVRSRNAERGQGHDDRNSTRRREIRVERLGPQDETVRPTGYRLETVMTVEGPRSVVDGIDDHVAIAEIARAGGAAERARHEIRSGKPRACFLVSVSRSMKYGISV